MTRNRPIAPPALALLAAAAVASVAGADRRSPVIELEYRPQQAVAAVEIYLDPDALQMPLAIRVSDSRSEESRRQLGIRTDDDDRSIDLEARDAVAPFVQGVAERVARDLGVRVDPKAALVLGLEIVRFRVLETNQAVGATYSAQVQLGARLLKATGGELWQGTAAGDASRYGKKFSADNINEVFSDALLEALGAALSQRNLHRAWAAGPDAPAKETVSTPKVAAAPVSPGELLAEVERLVANDLSTETMLTFLAPRKLSAPFSADDLVAWKRAGVPEEVLQAALELPVR